MQIYMVNYISMHWMKGGNRKDGTEIVYNKQNTTFQSLSSYKRYKMEFMMI